MFYCISYLNTSVAQKYFKSPLCELRNITHLQVGFPSNDTCEPFWRTNQRWQKSRHMIVCLLEVWFPDQVWSTPRVSALLFLVLIEQNVWGQKPRHTLTLFPCVCLILGPRNYLYVLFLLHPSVCSLWPMPRATGADKACLKYLNLPHLGGL